MTNLRNGKTTHNAHHPREKSKKSSSKSKSSKTCDKRQRTRKCEYCHNGVQFDTIILMKMHIATQHNIEAVKCLLCTEVFNKYAPYDTIRKHYERKHRKHALYEASLKTYFKYLKKK